MNELIENTPSTGDKIYPDLTIRDFYLMIEEEIKTEENPHTLGEKPPEGYLEELALRIEAGQASKCDKFKEVLRKFINFYWNQHSYFRHEVVLYGMRKELTDKKKREMENKTQPEIYFNELIHTLAEEHGDQSPEYKAKLREHIYNRWYRNDKFNRHLIEQTRKPAKASPFYAEDFDPSLFKQDLQRNYRKMAAMLVEEWDLTEIEALAIFGCEGSVEDLVSGKSEINDTCHKRLEYLASIYYMMQKLSIMPEDRSPMTQQRWMRKWLRHEIDSFREHKTALNLLQMEESKLHFVASFIGEGLSHLE